MSASLCIIAELSFSAPDPDGHIQPLADEVRESVVELQGDTQPRITGCKDSERRGDAPSPERYRCVDAQGPDRFVAPTHQPLLGRRESVKRRLDIDEEAGALFGRAQRARIPLDEAHAGTGFQTRQPRAYHGEGNAKSSRSRRQTALGQYRILNFDARKPRFMARLSLAKQQRSFTT